MSNKLLVEIALMIIDDIRNASLYYNLNPNIAAALQHLEKTDFSRMEPGRYDLNGDDCYVIVQDYTTKPKEEKAWEAHRKYIDIQYIAEGAELMGYTNIHVLKPTTGYNEQKDIVFLEGNGDFLTAPKGTFIILYPEDAHMPGVAADITGQVRKVVVKVRV